MDTEAIYRAVCDYGTAKYHCWESDAADHLSEIKRLLREAEDERAELLKENARLHDLAGGWRPIETAPKDGTAVLVSEGRFCHCVEWNEEFDWWAVDDNKLGPFRLRGAAPTHWMPPPPPPEAA